MFDWQFRMHHWIISYHFSPLDRNIIFIEDDKNGNYKEATVGFFFFFFFCGGGWGGGGGEREREREGWSKAYKEIGRMNRKWIESRNRTK
jgi:hypothetical protein